MGAFESNSLKQFWCKREISYTKIQEIALCYLMLLSTTYLYAQEFSALPIIKNESKNRLKVSDDVRRVALSKNILYGRCKPENLKLMHTELSTKNISFQL